MPSLEVMKRRKSRGDTKMLTATSVEAIDVAKDRLTGPCSCCLDVHLSDTIRNIFDQVDVEQRKMAEHTYLKYIATKIMTGTTEVRATFLYIFYFRSIIDPFLRFSFVVFFILEFESTYL